MINWEIFSYVFDRINDGPRYNLEGDATVYGQGQWASNIRYHMGKFYVWFTANGVLGKGFVYTADKAEALGHLSLVLRTCMMVRFSLMKMERFICLLIMSNCENWIVIHSCL